jgi:hypothetical protein
MPNRKSFHDGDKYDHSSHPVSDAQPSDLKPDVANDADQRVEPVRVHAPRRPDKRRRPTGPSGAA